MALSRQGELVGAGFTGGRPLSIQGRLCQMGALEMEEESSKVRVMRGGEFPGNEQSKRTVSQWWTCSLQPLEGEQGCDRDNGGRDHKPRVPSWEGTDMEAEQGEATGGVPGQ